ncbi:MAG: hypothetical protein AB1626_05995 [Candidatus Micrarchaeota archaeon]
MKKILAALLFLSSFAAAFEASSASFNLSVFDSAPVAEEAAGPLFDLKLLIPDQPVGSRMGSGFCLCLGALCVNCAATASLSFTDCLPVQETPFSLTVRLIVRGSPTCDSANARLDVVEPDGGTQLGLAPASCAAGDHVFQPAISEGGTYYFTAYSLNSSYTAAPASCATTFVPAPNYLVFVRDDGAIGCPLSVHEPLNQTIRLQVNGSLTCDQPNVLLNVTYPNGTTATELPSSSCSGGDHRYPLALNESGTYYFRGYSTNGSYSVDAVSCSVSFIPTEYRVSRVPETHWLLALAAAVAAVLAMRFKRRK